MHVATPSVVVDDIRHCLREDFDHDNTNENDNANANRNSNINDDINTRKKMRLPGTVDPALEIWEENEAQELQQPSPSPPRQWWFSRHSLPAPLAGSASSFKDSNADLSPIAQKDNVSGMVLSEHLGRASDVVESLTHDVKNWSLTRLSPTPTSTTAPTKASGRNGCSSSCSSTLHTDSDRKKEKQTRCKDAQRQVRMARRRCLEAQKLFLLSSTNSAAITD